jgi:hypothetical protein
MGLVASLNQPGGSITGATNITNGRGREGGLQDDLVAIAAADQGQDILHGMSPFAVKLTPRYPIPDGSNVNRFTHRKKLSQCELPHGAGGGARLM